MLGKSAQGKGSERIPMSLFFSYVEKSTFDPVELVRSFEGLAKI